VSTFELMEQGLSDPSALERLASHPEWRVRYAAAIGMGETRDARWLPVLRDLMEREATRDLYGQPQVKEFIGSYDDTLAAEQLVATEAVWERPPTPEQRDDWQCRGRVRQAAVLAVHSIGQSDETWEQLLLKVMHDGKEDSVVRTAAAKALSRVGSRASIAGLRDALAIDEWCLAIEVRKTLRALGEAVDE
jgi:HEAT repeat protein